MYDVHNGDASNTTYYGINVTNYQRSSFSLYNYVEKSIETIDIQFPNIDYILQVNHDTELDAIFSICYQDPYFFLVSMDPSGKQKILAKYDLIPGPHELYGCSA
jgi:hypothetical protein